MDFWLYANADWLQHCSGSHGGGESSNQPANLYGHAKYMYYITMENACGYVLNTILVISQALEIHFY